MLAEAPQETDPGSAMNIVFASITLAVITLPLRGAECRSLDATSSFQVAAPQLRSLCFDLRVAANEAVQLTVDSPLDTAIHLREGGGERLVDAFEFGPETATIIGPAKYRVTVSAVSPVASASRVMMSREHLALHAAPDWLRAEDLATRSKAAATGDNSLAALHAWEAVGSTLSVARTRLTLGRIAYRDGKYRDALDQFNQARALCAMPRNDRCVAEAISDAGMSANKIGAYATALELVRTAAAQWKSLGNPLNAGITLSNLGLIYRRIGDLKSAISVSDEAVGILRGEDEGEYAKAVNNLGLCYQVVGQYDEAAALFRRALDIHERHREPAAVGTRLNLGRTLYLSGDLRNARILLEEAVARATKSRATRAEAQSNLGQVYLQLRLYEAAGQRLHAALDTFREIGDLRNEAAAEQYLGQLARQCGDAAGAAGWFEQALALRTALGLREDTADSLATLAALERESGRIDSARGRVEEALQLLESVRLDVPGPALRASYYARKRSLFDLLVDLEAESSGREAAGAALLAAERGRSRSLMDQLADGRVLRQIPAALEARREHIQHDIDLRTAELNGPAAENPVALRDELRGLISQDAAVEAQIRSALGRDLAQPLPSVEELRGDLREDSGLLEYYLGERKSYLWLIRRNQVLMWNLPPRAEIERDVRTMSSLFGEIQERLTQPAKRGAFERAIRKLSLTLLGPLYQMELPPRLILSLDSALLPLPFAALRLPGESRALGLEHDLIQIPSAGYLHSGNEPKPISAFAKTILVFADPVFSADDPRVHGALPERNRSNPALSRLPFTAELDVVSRLVPPGRRKVLEGFQATRSSLERLPLGDYAVLHFSTHALIENRTPELSRLVLSLVDPAGRPLDGFLRPYQLARMRLNGSVVVLSACDTALGKPVPLEGLVGLESSLFYAGAGQLVLTLTQVDAQGSSYLLAQAYRHLLGTNRLSVERAFTLARRKLEASERFHDPYYWASFVVIGKPAQEERF
jgi:CHAT domain-containing protein/tetratricopeptide (TPR) repeat protein